MSPLYVLAISLFAIVFILSIIGQSIATVKNKREKSIFVNTSNETENGATVTD